MFSSFLLALREGVEAALVVGILFGALRKLQRPELASSIWWGVISAALVSLLVAAGLRVAGAELEGAAEEIFEGFAMLAAAALLTWMIFWMHRQARYLRENIEAGVRKAAAANSKGALFMLAFTAVGREGIELALFLMAARYASEPMAAFLGAVAGLSIAVVLGYILFASTYRLNLQRFFQVTNLLLLLFAAGLLAHGVHEFNEVGLIPGVIDPVYDINWLIPDKSPIGLMLTAMFGYNGNPTLTEMLTYVVGLVGLGFATLPRARTSAVEVG